MNASIALNAAPIFLSKPYLNTDAFNAGAIVVSSGDAFKHRVFDLVRSTQWVTQGENSDAVASTYQSKLYDGSTVSARDVDFIGLYNVNLKNFKLQYRLSGGAWATFPGMDYSVGTADFSSTDLLVPLNAVVTFDELLLTCYATQTANQEKAVGGLIVAKMTFQPSRGLATYSRAPQDTVITVQMGDGSLDETTILRGDDGFSFERSQLSFLGITQADMDSFDALRGDGFLFVPEPGNRPQDIFLCRVSPGSYRKQYLSLSRVPAMYSLSFGVEEMGGA